jgi:phage protein D
VITQVRSAIPQILIGGTDFYGDLAPYVSQFSYTDSIGKADDFSLTLNDRDERFITDSFPLKAGVELDVWIATYNWRFPGDNRRRDCGLFQIDSVSFSFPPSRVTVKATSIPGTTTLKNSKRSRPFENTSFRGVVDQIAGEQAMSVLWDTQDNPRFKRVEQNEQSDLEFIQKLCEDANLVLKIKRKQFVVFSEKEYEQRPATFTITKGLNVIDGTCSTNMADTAKEAEVQFVNPETGKLTVGTAVDSRSRSKDKIRSSKRPTAEPDGAYQLLPTPPNPRVDPLIDYTNDEPSQNKGKGAGLKAAATKKAESELRKANRNENRVNIGMMGEPTLNAGQTVNLAGCGQFDGKFIIDSLTHDVIPTYRCRVSMHKELGGNY